MLLQAKKEFAICGDLRPDDVFFYYTTTLVINMTKLDLMTLTIIQGMDDVEFPCQRIDHRLHTGVI